MLLALWLTLAWVTGLYLVGFDGGFGIVGVVGCCGMRWVCNFGVKTAVLYALT